MKEEVPPPTGYFVRFGPIARKSPARAAAEEFYIPLHTADPEDGQAGPACTSYTAYARLEVPNGRAGYPPLDDESPDDLAPE